MMRTSVHTRNNYINRNIIFIICIFFISGCASSDHALIITKTSVGVDIEASPPTMSIAYSRKEGVFSPQFSKGALPVLATVNKDVGFFDSSVGQSMATGKAAVILSKYLISNAVPASINTFNETEIENESKLDIPIGEEGEPYFFGTDTVYGFNISFDASSPVPGVNLGYKRKEIAYVSILKTPIATDAKKMSVSMPSLLALSQISSDNADVNNTGLVYEQIFATGNAATNFTKYPQIRQKLGLKLVPLTEEDKQEIKSELKDLEAIRKAEFASVQTQARVDEIQASIGLLKDADVISLEQNPPISDVAFVNNIIAIRDAPNNRRNDAILSRSILKMRVAKGTRTPTELATWEVTIKKIN